MRIVSIGELLWDVFGNDEFLGGAPVNFCVHAERLHDSALILTAVGSDDRGRRALVRLQALGLTTELVQSAGALSTGTALVQKAALGNGKFTIDRPAAFDSIELDNVLLTRIQSMQPDWFYFGTLAMTNPRTESILLEMVQKSPRTRRFYDINLREGHWTLALVERLSGIATVLKLNEMEAEQLAALTTPDVPFELENFCRHWAETFRILTICITLGGAGCAALHEGHFERHPGYEVQVADTVGAGDSFAAAFFHQFDAGWPIDRVAAFANAVGALVASRDGATPSWDIEECHGLMTGTKKLNRTETNPRGA